VQPSGDRLTDAKGTDTKVTALLQTHIRRYPHMDALDVYRLLHQAAFGVGRPVENVKAAREWLEYESSQKVTGGANEVLVENIHPHDLLVRLYVRPYLAARGEVPALLNAFIATSKEHPKDYSDGARNLEAWWNTFADMIAVPPYSEQFDVRKVTLIGQLRRSEKWSAAMHSPAYDRTYKPVYRVLLRSQAEKLLRDQGIAFEVV
jgi:hypothetical protein